jgi:hypothetical protein
MNQCAARNCKRAVLDRGLCSRHLQQFIQTGIDPSVSRVCKVEGCKNKVNAVGLCNMHYKRLLKHGDVNTVLPRAISSGRRRGSYFYSDEDIISAVRPGDTLVSYMLRTGISQTTVYNRFPSWEHLKALARGESNAARRNDQSAPGKSENNGGIGCSNGEGTIPPTGGIPSQDSGARVPQSQDGQYRPQASSL